MKTPFQILAGAALLAVVGCAAGARYDGSETDSGTADTDRADGSHDATDRDANTLDAGDDTVSEEPCTGQWVDLCTTSCGSVGTRTCDGNVFGACQPPLEDCNGRDDDCDGNIDEDLVTRACSSACGGGSETCFSGAWSGCDATNPQVETCNGLDDNCDSRIDEDLSRPCSTACGSGAETCRSGGWIGCDAPHPTPEACNAVDDDCDGTIDDLTRDCSTACGVGIEPCERGGWGRCTALQPTAETCNGLDDNCNGQVDEGLTRNCSTACGAGVETCSGGNWVGCTAPPLPAEQCNGLDDDCDGAIDEGVQVHVYTVPMADLTAMQPPCASAASGLDVCLSAAHRWCAQELPCLRSGAGLLSASGGMARVVCFAGEGVFVEESFAQVSAVTGVVFTESEAHMRVAQSGANRFCRQNGYGAGIGPLEHSSGNMFMVCLPSGIGTTESIATSELRALGCDPLTSQVDTLACSTASDTACQAMGYLAGFGPVEWNTSDSAVNCFDP
jgi:hypothetical protein